MRRSHNPALVFGGVRRSAAGDLRGPGASGLPGPSGGACRPGRRQAHADRAGRGDRVPEGSLPWSSDGRWRHSLDGMDLLRPAAMTGLSDGFEPSMKEAAR